jgi:murein peptide amidase A
MERRWVFDALVLATAMMALPFQAPVGEPAAVPETPLATPAPETDAGTETLGESVRGRAIRATRLGEPDAPVSVLAVGCVHGDETAGRAVILALRSADAPAGVALWLIGDANPDGCGANTRQNANGVDLNRNFPYRWEPLPPGTYHSGSGPLSEPESRALHAFLRAQRPVVSVWYHQHAELVDAYGDEDVARRYARRVGLPYKFFYAAPGSITRWQAHTFAGSTGIVVELPAGELSARAALRHADAVLALAREVSG